MRVREVRLPNGNVVDKINEVDGTNVWSLGGFLAPTFNEPSSPWVLSLPDTAVVKRVGLTHSWE